MRAADFTTYISAVQDPSITTKFGRLALDGTRAFSQIQTAAKAASYAIDAALSGRGLSSSGTSALRAQAQAATQAASTSERIARSANVATNAQRANATAAGLMAREHEVLARSLRTTADALGVIQGPLGPLAGRFSALGRTLQTLTGFQLGAAAIGGIAFAVARMGTNYTTLEGRLRPYFQTQSQVNLAMGQMVGIATRSRAALEPVADLYTKLTASADQFHFSQQRVARVTELATKAATLSGGTAQSREAGLYQFSQGIASNRFGGDELRSVLENIPALAQAISAGLGITIGDLRKLGKEGALTAKQVTDALLRSSDTIETRFAKLPLTLSTAATNFGTAMTVTVGQMDRAVGLSHGLAEALNAVTNNLRVLLSTAAGIGIAFAGIRITNWAKDIVGGVIATRQLQTGFEGVAVAVRAQAQQEATAAAERAGEAAAAQEQSAARVIALRAELAELIAQRQEQVRIAALNAELALQSKGTVIQSGAGLATVGGLAAEQEILRKLAVTNADLRRARLAQAAATDVATNATRASSVANAELNAIQSTSVVRSGLFTRALGLLKGSLPTIAIMAAVTAITYLATAQSDGERATDRARKAMELYGSVIDDTTGKVKDLGRAENDRKKKEAQDAINAYKSGDPGDRGHGASAGSELGGAFFQARLRNPKTDVGPRVAELNALAEALSKSGDSAAQALARIRTGAQAGDPVFRDFIMNSKEAIDRFRDLHDAAVQGKKTLDAYKGATDPGFLERQALAQADVAANVQQTAAEYRQLAKEQNTLNDNARFNTNLKEAYTKFGIPSPDDIQKIRDRITNLNRIKPAAGGEQQRAASLKGLNDELQEAIRNNTQYKGTIEASARALTTAQTAERDRHRQISADNKEQHDAIEQEKANAAARLNNSLLELEKIRPSLTPAEYIEAQGKLLTIYDQQIDALNNRANSSQKAETAAIRAARAINQASQQFAQRHDDIMGRYTDDPKAVQRAAADIRALQEAQAKLGEGIYPKATLDRDIDAIQNGLQKPFREMVKDQERARQIEVLTLEGRQAEAIALRQAFELQDATGQVTKEQYDTLLANAQQEEKINDILSSRGRIVEGLTSAVDTIRSALTDVIAKAHEGPAAAGKAALGALKQVQDAFYHAAAQSLVERLTAGADEKVRALISGKNAVDSASRYFATQVTSTSSNVLTLGQASQTTAETMVKASSDMAAKIDSIISTMNAPLGVSGGVASATGGGGTVGTIAAAVGQAITRHETMLAPISGGGTITSGFSNRTNPITGKQEFHTGLDIAAAFGTAVRSAFSGKVQSAGTKGGYGNAVVIDSGHGLTELYGHLSKLNVSIGQLVRQGQVIGQVGSTGMSTGNHLHFGTYRNGVPVNPQSVVQSLVSASGVIGGGGFSIPQAQTAPATSANFQDLSEAINSLTDPSSPLKIVDLSHAGQDLPGMSSPGDLQAFVQSIAGNPWSFDPIMTASGANGRVPSARDAYNQMGGAVGENVGKVFDKVLGTNTSPFFKNIGSQFGTALQGAGEGAIASGFAKAIGIKQSQTGAQIGGAIGSFLPIPGGAIIGGLIGGTLGGLLKKPKQGGATLSLDQYGNIAAGSATGNDASSKSNATGLATSVASALDQIASQLGGKLTGGTNLVSLGYRASDKKQPFRVDPSGAGRATGSGVLAFATEEEAVSKAIELMVERGVIGGISAASQRILASGQDLQKAIQKASLIESIPKQLLQRTNPVAYAVQQLNEQFGEMISALKEGGATLDQFKDAAKLYDLERADAIQQATQDTVSALDDFLRQMTNSDASPLSKRTVYENAKAAFSELQGKVNAGQAVNQNDLVTAAKDFEDSSRTLKGSTSSFFQDFDTIFATLTAAKNLASSSTTTTPGDLPASPFTTDPQVAAMLSQATGTQVSAINNQTDVLSGQLQDIHDAIIGLGGQGGGGGGAIDYLPSFNGEASSARYNNQGFNP